MNLPSRCVLLQRKLLSVWPVQFMSTHTQTHKRCGGGAVLTAGALLLSAWWGKSRSLILLITHMQCAARWRCWLNTLVREENERRAAAPPKGFYPNSCDQTLFRFTETKFMTIQQFLQEWCDIYWYCYILDMIWLKTPDLVFYLMWCYTWHLRWFDFPQIKLLEMSTSMPSTSWCEILLICT